MVHIEAGKRRLLPFHHPGDPTYSLVYITESQSEWDQRAVEESEKSDFRVIKEVDRITEGTRYLLYRRYDLDHDELDFETLEDLVEWADTQFSPGVLQVVLAVARIFRGILKEKDETGNELQLYKEIEFEKIETVIQRVEWGQSVVDVGADLLSTFIIEHPMPNTNHRTGIGLLDRYLTSIEPGFSMPDTGEEGIWYNWAKDFIYNSKRVLLLEWKTPLFRFVSQLGYDGVQRKEGIKVFFDDYNLDVGDHRTHFSKKHHDLCSTFVEEAAMKAGCPDLRSARDPGMDAFFEALRKN